MEFLQYFGPVFTLSSMAILCAGTVGGLLLGATPGLSPTMAVALLIPFTFHMDPAQGLMLLGAAYTATVAGGAVSAILLKIPGAPANIATALDGYPMARAGHGARALQLCFISSFIGGVIGVLVLIFLTPVLAQWALGFGPSHLFWIAILGVTIIGTLDSKSVVKGLLAGCIGLWISMIGYDSIQGVDRFIFSDYLTGGVHIIPALIGLFAIPQIIEMVEGGRYKRSYDLIEVRPHSVWKSAIETVSSVRAWVIGSISGIIVGLIPGAGGQIAGLVAYDQTRRFSPNGHKFGTGEPEGVISAESANNAMVGPSLVPLLTLSVPGSPTAAVLLGGLLIHGIFPGPNLFTNHPDVAWAFINSLLIGQALMLIFGLYIAGLAAHVVRIPPAILASGVLVLAVFGAYSVQNSQGDVVVMLMLGLGMYFLQQYGFSAAPLVLGVILGPIAETNYVQGRIIAGASDGMFAYFFTGPLNLLLIAFVVFSIIYSIVSEVRWRRSEAQRIGDAQGAAI
jgi:putative tricarboxylic transport membrane protein